MTQLAKDSATPTSSSMKGFCGLLDISCLKAARSSVVITNHDSRAVPQEKSEYDTHSSQDESVKAASNFWFAQLSGDKPFVVLRTMSNVSEGESRPCISCPRFGDSCETTGRSLTLYIFDDETRGHLEPCCDTVSPRLKSVVWRNELIGTPNCSAAWTESDYGLPAYQQTRLCTSCSSRPRSRAGCSCFRWIGLLNQWMALTIT